MISILVGIAIAFLAYTPLVASASSEQVALAPSIQPVEAGKTGWARSMRETRMPKAGCFTASYPDLEWRESSCVQAPMKKEVRLPPRPSVKSAADTIKVAEANQEVVALNNQSSFTSVSASFPTVLNVQSISTLAGQTSEPNTFSLQLNTKPYFPTPTCKQSTLGNPSECWGWIQFIVNSDEQHAYIFMELYLFNFGDCSKAPRLPAQPPPSFQWTAVSPGSTSCFADTASIQLPPIAISELGSISVRASVSDGLDTVTFIRGGTISGISIPDSMIQLTGLWTGATFNLYGYHGGETAALNPGSGLVARMETESGDSSVPTLGADKYTGESNNMIVAFPGCMTAGAQGSVEFAEAVNGTQLSASNLCPPGFVIPPTPPQNVCKQAHAGVSAAQRQLAAAQAAIGTARCAGPASYNCVQAVKAAQSNLLAEARLEKQACKQE